MAGKDDKRALILEHVELWPGTDFRDLSDSIELTFAETRKLCAEMIVAGDIAAGLERYKAGRPAAVRPNSR